MPSLCCFFHLSCSFLLSTERELLSREPRNNVGSLLLIPASLTCPTLPLTVCFPFSLHSLRFLLSVTEKIRFWKYLSYGLIALFFPSTFPRFFTPLSSLSLFLPFFTPSSQACRHSPFSSLLRLATMSSRMSTTSTKVPDPPTNE